MPINNLDSIKEAIANNKLEGLPLEPELIALLTKAVSDRSINTTDLIKRIIES